MPNGDKPGRRLVIIQRVLQPDCLSQLADAGVELVLADQDFALGHVLGYGQNGSGGIVPESLLLWHELSLFQKDRLLLARIFWITFCRISEGARCMMKGFRARHVVSVVIRLG